MSYRLVDVPRRNETKEQHLWREKQERKARRIEYLKEMRREVIVVWGRIKDWLILANTIIGILAGLQMLGVI